MLIAKAQRLIDEAEVVTFDIWDTLLRRNCHPEVVKLHMAGVLIEALQLFVEPPVRAAYELRLQVERQLATQATGEEYTLQEVLVEWVKAYRPEWGAAQVDTLVAQLYARELALEKAVSCCDAAGFDLLLRAQGKAYFLSDFYMGEGLRAILEHHRILDRFKGGLVSCEMRASKRLGALFPRAKEVLGLPRGWLHIGDNPAADVAQAKPYVQTAVRFSSVNDYCRRAHEAGLDPRIREGAGLRLPKWSRRMGLGALGEAMAPIFIGFCQQVKAQAERVRPSRICFFTREGVFLHRIFTMLYPELADLAMVLEVSRKATFFASLSGVTPEAFAPMWAQYGSQSPEAFFKSLAVPETPVLRQAIAQAGVEWSAPLTTAQWSQVLQLPEVTATLEVHLARAKAQLHGYLSTALGVPGEGGPLMVIDVGWRGSIQDNLARACPEVRWVGVYFGLAPFLGPLAANVEKTAYVVDARRQEDWAAYLKIVLPFEVLLNASSGSVVGYAQREGQWVAACEPLQGEAETHGRLSAPFQRAVLDALPLVRSRFSEDLVSNQEILEYSRRTWRALVERPPYLVMHHLLGVTHNEGFGVGTVVRYQFRFSARDLWQALRDKGARSRLAHAIDALPWPRQLLSLPGVPWATRGLLLCRHMQLRLKSLR